MISDQQFLNDPTSSEEESDVEVVNIKEVNNKNKIRENAKIMLDNFDSSRSQPRKSLDAISMLNRPKKVVDFSFDDYE